MFPLTSPALPCSAADIAGGGDSRCPLVRGQEEPTDGSATRTMSQLSAPVPASDRHLRARLLPGWADPFRSSGRSRPKWHARCSSSNTQLGPIFSANLVGQCIGLVVFPLGRGRAGQRTVVLTCLAGFRHRADRHRLPAARRAAALAPDHGRVPGRVPSQLSRTRGGRRASQHDAGLRS